MLNELRGALRAWTALLRTRPLPGERLPEERVMMFHPGRSGSTVLARMIDQHPEVNWQGEAILQFFQDVGLRRLRVPPERILLDRMSGLEERMVGFEVQYYQLSVHLGIGQADFVRRILDLGFRRFIVLSRRNVLRAVVSNLVAIRRKRWEFSASDRVDLTRIHVNLDRVYDHPRTEILQVLARHEKDMYRIHGLLPSYLELVYEDDVEDDPRVGYRQICAHLGLEPIDVTIPTRRATPWPLSQIVENWDHVRGRLRGTRFEWMLEEG